MIDYKKRNRDINKLFLFLVMVITISSFFSFFSMKSASAVGITGSNDFMIFQPYLNKTYSYIVVSNTDKTMDHAIGVNGDLMPYAHLSTEVLKDIPINGQGSFTMNLTLPESLEPGLHTLTLCAVEASTRGPGGEDGSSIGTRAAVCLIIRVLSLYPEKLAEFDFYAPDIGSGAIEEFMLDVSSLSQQDMLIKGQVDVYTNTSGSLVKLVTLSTDEKMLKSGGNEKLIAYLDTKNFEIGEYIAKGTLYYDDKAPIKEQKFRIGDLAMGVVNFSNSAYTNRVNELKIFANSKWNSDIKGVYAEMTLTRGDFKRVISSPAETFYPWEVKPLTLFLDTKGMPAGDYNVGVNLYYNEKIESVGGVFKVINKVDISGSTILLIVIILVLIIIFLIIIWFTRKKMKQLEGRNRKKKVNNKKSRIPK
jgi:hypothetical protein